MGKGVVVDFVVAEIMVLGLVLEFVSEIWWRDREEVRVVGIGHC